MAAGLQEIAGHLIYAAEHYGDRYILRDDAGADPQARITEAVAQLQQLRAALAPAIAAGHGYHSAIGHIAVQVDPDAEEE